jgi:hypothetical protein
MTIIRDTHQILTPAQIAELRGLYDAKKVQDQTIGGLWSEVYEKLYGFITDYYTPVGPAFIGADLNPIPDMPKVGIDKQTWLWLRGARYINAGTGPFAALIRETTIIQYHLRYGGEPISQARMDEASNNIARNFLGQWLGYKFDENDQISVVAKTQAASIPVTLRN